MLVLRVSIADTTVKKYEASSPAFSREAHILILDAFIEHKLLLYWCTIAI